LVADAFELEKFFEGCGVLALHAGGVEADVVEGSEVWIIGGEDASFEGGDAEKAPLEVDEFAGERGFDFGGRGEVADDLVGEGLIFGGIFAGQENGLRRESVLEGVLRGDGFGFGGARSGRVLRVEDVGGHLGSGRHRF
jgi:hypothetical protein